MKYVHLLLSCLLVNIGIYFLHSAHIGTGGTVGLGLSITYWTNIAFPITYTFINLPFFILSWKKLGRNFTLSTLFSIIIVSCLSYFTSFLPTLPIPTLIGGIIGSILAGIGMILLFLNQSSLGGTGILSIYLQKRFQIDPGKSLFLMDFLIILSTLYSIGWIGFFYSGLSALIVSTMVSLYRKRINEQYNENEQEVQSDCDETSTDLPVLQ